MFSFSTTDIKEAKVRAAIAKARSESGVHIYMDVPDTKQGKTFFTPLANLKSTGSKYLRWTFLCRARENENRFAIQLMTADRKLGVIMGISVYTHFYSQILEKGAWHQTQKDWDKHPLKKGQYAVLTMDFTYPEGTKVEPLKITLNGGELAHTAEWISAKDFTTFAAILALSTNVFLNTEILEHHLIYTGMTAGLPPRGTKANCISFEKASLCFLSQGSTAVIVGQYVNSNSSYSGIMIGVATKAESLPRNFASHNDDNKHVTFRVSVGFMDVAITTDKEQKLLAMTIGPEDYAWLIVDNINIFNMEIHTGTKDRNT